MAKKYYAVKVGKKPGIYYREWSQVEPLTKGYPGAKYKGFTSREEAEAFMNDAAVDSGVKKPAKASAGSVDVNIVSPKEALENLKKVKVDIGKNPEGRFEQCFIQSDKVRNRWVDTCRLIDEMLQNAYSNPVDVQDFANRNDVQNLARKYGMNLNETAVFDDIAKEFDAVAFVDGGGNKGAGDDIIDLGIEGENLKYASSKIVYGVVLCNLKQKTITLYRYVMDRSIEYKDFFRQSNVAGEELAALLAMYIFKKEGLEKVCIYQDNNLPAKYYSGKFKAIHNRNDAPGQIFINSSIDYLEDGMDINFLYVPSEHECASKKDKLEKGRKMYEAQDIIKLSFDQAEFFNGISDRLADYNIE